MADAPNSPHPSEPSPRRLSSDPPRDPAEPPEHTAEKTRRVVDFELDDGDAAWEDEDEQLAGLGTTTHRSRNHRAPVIPMQKHRRIEPGVNVRATAQKCQGDTAKKMQNLAADLDELEVERKECAQALSAKHGMKVKETQRKASLYNAKISRIMRDLNEDRSLGERYKIPEVKRMVVADASMLDGFTPEEEEEMMADLVAKRKRKYHGKRANNLAASADAKCTVERLMLECFILTTVADYGSRRARGDDRVCNVHPRPHPRHVGPRDDSVVGRVGFYPRKKDPTDISTLFELWAVNRKRGETGSDTLIAMQQECTSIIKAGLQAILGKTKVAMNYENYIKAIVEGKNVGLVGWPEGVDFKCMSKQSAIGPLRILCDALKCGTCKWKVLTAGEKSHLLAQFKEMVKNGEAHEKRAARKRGSDGDDDQEEDESRPRKARSRPKRAARERGSDYDDEQEEDELRPRKAIADMSRDERVDNDNANERPTRKKHAGAGEDKNSHPRRKRSDRGDGDEDEVGGGRKKKRKSDDAPRTKASSKTSAPPAPPRPKPKPKPRVAVPTAGNPNGPLTSTASAPVAGAPTASSPAACTSTPNTDPAATAASSADAESAAASRRQNVVVGKRGGPPGQRYIA
ncbi:hypothetical protein B0H14DRAFT_2589513 [Mycena olivaceomarginata]|nr:hypothetical protein B0H14DRAFT_2589513 [Mycena olivaceomarginata]